jgi:transketolase
MRNEFVDELTKLAARDERVMLLTGDLGFSVLERFQQAFPERFINCGVAEQNMVGVATGLAEAGLIPFAYSIATFASLRPYEFIRNGPILHGLPVRVVGVGGGFDYGQNGITHFALEDYAVMRAQPAMTVISPADADQARAAIRATADEDRPIYFRVSKKGTPVPGLEGRFRLGRLEVLSDEGADAAILAIGSITHEAVAAAQELAGRGIRARVAVVSSLNPSPVQDIAAFLSGVPLALTVEAHYANGGLGSLVAEIIAEEGLSARLVRAAVHAMPGGESGSQAYLEDRHGLSAAKLVGAVEGALNAVG